MVRLSRLPTVDDSPPPRAASPPPGDLYTALREPLGGRRGGRTCWGWTRRRRRSWPTCPGHWARRRRRSACRLRRSGPWRSSRLPPPPPPAEPCGAPLTTDEDEDFGEFVCVEQQRSAAGGVSSRHGSLPSLDLQVAPASDGGEVSPLEPDRRDGADADRPPDKYDSFRQELVSVPAGGERGLPL